MPEGGVGGEPAAPSQGGKGNNGGGGIAGKPATPQGGAPDAGGAGTPDMAGAPAAAGAGGEGGNGSTAISCDPGTDHCSGDPASCESLASDQYCGSCQRDCTAGGTTCTTMGSAHYCKTITLVDTGGQGFLGTIGTDSVFAAQTGGMPVGDYKLVRIPFKGAASTVWSGTGYMGNGGVTVTATNVYWAVSGSPATVQTKPLTAKPADLPSIVFKPTATPAWLMLHGNAFYWMTGGLGVPATIFTRAMNAQPMDVGTEIMSVDQGQVSRLTSGTSAMYWTGRNGVATYTLWYVPWAGGQPKQVPDAIVQDVSSLYARGTTLYFSSRSGASSAVNGIYSFTIGDATVKQLVQSDSVYTLIADDNYVYYRTTLDYAVWRAPVTGGASEQIGVAAFDIFAGQDATRLFTIGAWGSAGPALEILK